MYLLWYHSHRAIMADHEKINTEIRKIHEYPASVA